MDAGYLQRNRRKIDPRDIVRVAGTVWNRSGPLVSLAFMIAVAAALSPNTVTLNHGFEIVLAWAPLGIVALGQLMALLTGGLDLSVGSVITLVNVTIAVYAAGKNQLALPVLALGLGLALVVGIINAVAIVEFHINPLIATLSTNMVTLGVALAISGAAPTGIVPTSLRWIGVGHVGPFPVAGLVWFALAIILALLLRRTVFGRRYYAVGSSQAVARLAGIPVKLYQSVAYVACAFLAGLSGVLLTAYTGVGALDIGSSYNLDSIAVVMIGGASFTGGRGGVLGTVAGVFILAILFDVLATLSIPYSQRAIARGLIILIAVFLYSRQARNQ